MDSQPINAALSFNSSGLTTEQLLLLEQVCDQFEVDFQARRAVSIDACLAQLPVPLQARARIELIQLQECLSRGCSTHVADLPTPLPRGNIAATGGPIQPEDANGHRSSDTYNKHAGVQCASTQLKDIRAGRFELNQLLGSGSAGAVWRAFDRHLARWVALKIPLTNSSIDAERFLAEARTVARLHHPNIVRVLDACQDEQGCFIVSELVEGMTLSAKMKQTRYDPREAAGLISTIVGAVAHAHQSGIVHRDLKPQNILIDAHDRPMVLDFGLACEWFVGLPSYNQGKILGTPAYMAPEQAAGLPQTAEPGRTFTLWVSFCFSY